MTAEGQAQAKRALADAELYTKEKQADAVKAKLRAQVRSHYQSLHVSREQMSNIKIRVTHFRG